MLRLPAPGGSVGDLATTSTLRKVAAPRRRPADLLSLLTASVRRAEWTAVATSLAASMLCHSTVKIKVEICIFTRGS